MFFSPNSRCYSTVDDFVKKTKQSLQQNQRSTLTIVHSKSKLVTCMCSRTPKSFSNGPILCARNKKNTFKDVDTRSVPDVDNWLFSFPQIVVFQYCQPFIQESWSYDAQVYTNVFVYCAVFPNLPLLPASVGSERDFWEPGMGCTVKNPWLDAWQKDKSLCPKTFYFLDALPEIPIQQQ